MSLRPRAGHFAGRDLRAPSRFVARLGVGVLGGSIIAAMVSCHDVTAPSGFNAGSADTATGKWIEVSVGQNTSCALQRDGRAFCWGMNESRRLGIGNRVYIVEAPREVATDVRFRELSVGGSHQCAVAMDSAAYCWGSNHNGELGTGAGTGDAIVPTRVAGDVSFRAITTGFSHSCGLTAGGIAYCWGDNSEGQLGAGAGVPCGPEVTQCRSSSPVAVAGGLHFSQLSAGLAHTCGVAVDGVAYCWGGNEDGELGDPSIPVNCGAFPGRVACTRDTPQAVATPLRFLQLSAGFQHSCGVTWGLSAYCWGLVTRDHAIFAVALGNAAYTGIFHEPHGSRIPVPVEGGVSFREVSAGLGSSCGRSADGRTFCWGGNNFGQLGLAAMSPSYSTTPTPVHMPLGAMAPALTADDHACALAASGRVWCWGGYNFFGELGSPPRSEPGSADIRPTPAPIDQAQPALPTSER